MDIKDEYIEVFPSMSVTVPGPVAAPGATKVVHIESSALTEGSSKAERDEDALFHAPRTTPTVNY